MRPNWDGAQVEVLMRLLVAHWEAQKHRVCEGRLQAKGVRCTPWVQQHELAGLQC